MIISFVDKIWIHPNFLFELKPSQHKKRELLVFFKDEKKHYSSIK